MTLSLDVLETETGVYRQTEATVPPDVQILGSVIKMSVPSWGDTGGFVLPLGLRHKAGFSTLWGSNMCTPLGRQPESIRERSIRTEMPEGAHTAGLTERTEAVL